MNDLTRHALVHATITAGNAVFEKSASATPEQADVLQAAWPQKGEEITKLAAISRILATGLMVEEADMSLAQAAAG